MYAMTSRPYGWYLRIIAKCDQETTNCELFHFFFKNWRNDWTIIFYSNFKLCGGPMCAMRSTSYGWDLRNIVKIDQGTAGCELFSIFSNTVVRIRMKIFCSHFTLCGEPMCAMTLISYGWDLRNIAKIDQGTANCEHFQLF